MTADWFGGDWESFVSIELVQALLGLVTPNMEAVAVAAEPDAANEGDVDLG